MDKMDICMFACVYCVCSRSFSSKHSSTMSTIHTDSCQSSYDNLDAQSDSDDYSTSPCRLALPCLTIDTMHYKGLYIQYFDAIG